MYRELLFSIQTLSIVQPLFVSVSGARLRRVRLRSVVLWVPKSRVVAAGSPSGWLCHYKTAPMPHAFFFFCFSACSVHAPSRLLADFAPWKQTPTPYPYPRFPLPTHGWLSSLSRSKLILQQTAFPQEEDMYYCEETGEFIHPIFFDSQEEAREVRTNSFSATSSDPDAEVCCVAVFATAPPLPLLLLLMLTVSLLPLLELSSLCSSSRNSNPSRGCQNEIENLAGITLFFLPAGPHTPPAARREPEKDHQQNSVRISGVS